MIKPPEKDECRSNCPLRRALGLLEGKYSVDILRELLQGTKRFGELRKQIRGISPKTLTEKLKFFTEHGIINRRSYPEIPPKVEYQLTERGNELKSAISILEHLGKKFSDDSQIADQDDEQTRETVYLNEK